MSGARVDISLDELDELRSKLARAHETNGALIKRTQELEVSKAGDRADELLLLIDTALDLVQFSVANLDPATVRGWPWTALVAFADGLATLPGADDMRKELAIELRAFAHECKLHEIERAQRPIPVPSPDHDDRDAIAP